MTDIQEQVARALYAEYRARIPGSLTWENDSKADQFRAQAARLMPSIMPLVKRAQAEALREAAESLNQKFQELPAWVEAYREGVRTDEWMQGGVRMTVSAIHVLRDRADQIEKEPGE